MKQNSGVNSHLHSDDTLTWKPLGLLTLYRIALATLLLILFFFASDYLPLGSRKPGLFTLIGFAYLLFAFSAALTAQLRRPNYKLQVFTQIVIDCLVITLLLYTSGGQQSGLGFLLIVAVATGSLLMPERIAFLFAAIATLAILGEQSYSLLQGYNLGQHGFIQAGILGVALFTTASLAYILAKRAHTSEALAEQRGIDLANLATLNEHIIQQLPSGVIVVDQQQQIRLANQTARKILSLVQRNQSLHHVAPELEQQLKQWQQNSALTAKQFHVQGNNQTLTPSFTHLGDGSAILIFIEDSAKLAQQSQQIKLAALGQLTASIAHEIRNPLGAISHAGQLLNESSHLDADDKRLIEIIQNHSQRVNRIIESILQVSRRSPAQSQIFQLKTWLKSFVNEWQQSDPDNTWIINTRMENDKLEIHFDPGHLHQVLWNLCQNARKHSVNSRKQQIDIRAGIDNDNQQLWLKVIDYGEEIDATTVSNLFEPFFTTATDGTGLGLYIAREICESNQAQLEYHPSSSGGNCFCIHFTRKIE
ncbi:MAG: PAS domain-containing protein [Gammaproteobacteria bacterium]|nr:PAS domain-containing protein [Gammaproteobacteria bacterium]